MRAFYILFLGLLSGAALGQSRQGDPIVFQPSVGVQHFDQDSSNHSMVYRFGVSINEQAVFNQLANGGIQEAQYFFAREWRLSPNWYLQLGLDSWLQGSMENSYVVAIPTLLAGHRGRIKKLEFFKQLSIQRTWAEEKFRHSRAIGLMLGFAYPFQIQGQSFRFASSWQAYRIRPDEAFSNSYRPIDLGRLRLDFFYFPTPRIGLSLYAMRETRYLVQSIGSFTNDLNLSTQVYGLSLRLYLAPQGTDLLIKPFQ